jgi:hypothetical protein
MLKDPRDVVREQQQRLDLLSGASRGDLLRDASGRDRGAYLPPVRHPRAEGFPTAIVRKISVGHDLEAELGRLGTPRRHASAKESARERPDGAADQSNPENRPCGHPWSIAAATLRLVGKSVACS